MKVQSHFNVLSKVGPISLYYISILLLSLISLVAADCTKPVKRNKICITTGLTAKLSNICRSIRIGVFLSRIANARLLLYFNVKLCHDFFLQFNFC